MPAPDGDQPHDRLDRGGLAGAVAAEQRDELTGAHRQGDALQDVRESVVRLHVLELQQGRLVRSAGPISGTHRLPVR
jgi:hypothetical protein